MNCRVRPLLTLIAIAIPLLLVAGCESVSLNPGATAQLRPTTGNVASGTVRFVQRGNMVRVSGEVRGLKPNAEHGFHIHEKGDCSSGDGMSAGSHFNPDGKPHGQYGQGMHHAGDLPSLKADGNGVARINFEASTISLEGGPTYIIGKGLIVHRDPDDYRTQPTGNSGPRVACGVITAT
jgi:Cu-Zn family superoxide dismutase